MNLIVGYNNEENVFVLIDVEVKCEKFLLFIIKLVVFILIGINLYFLFKLFNIRFVVIKENFK